MNNWQPDPSWDYFDFWDSLLTLKSKIDESINLLMNEEVGNNNTDYKIAEISQEPMNSIQEYLDAVHLEMIADASDKS